MTIDQPLFEDHTSAGYDWTCDYVTRLIANIEQLDLNNPDDIWRIIRRLEGWTTQLRFHTPAPTPWTPTDDNPF